MSNFPTFIGGAPQKLNQGKITGAYVQLGDEQFYKISHSDQMRPFFMSIASSSDHWLFISSNGGLTAGRKNPEFALFPYYTDDKIHDSHETTGSKTIFRVAMEGKAYLWEPFSERYAGLYEVERNLYKNVFGDKIIFEEINHDLKLRFRYGWFTSDRFGVVRKVWVENQNEGPLNIELVDGLQNLLPFGVPMDTQTRLSTLVDAYKKNELEPKSGLGLYLLSAIIVDRAEPSEALKCNTVWSVGLENADRLICSQQLDRFRKGQPIEQEVDVRAERGAYFLHQKIQMAAGAEKSWYFVAEVNQGPGEVAALVSMLAEPQPLPAQLEADIAEGHKKLGELVGSSDGLQLTGDEAMSSRHFSNVLFNIMRGGVFHKNYEVQKADLLNFAEGFNPELAAKHHSFFAQFPPRFNYQELLQRAQSTGEPPLIRLCHEYLPVTFSRRHGDPSRPWNKFSIEVKNEDGSDKLYYAGNWRDIFQNWEALAYSFPDFTESMIAKFVNASTPDGYNPYRITRDGIDWEKVEPDDPWSYIGYWGDHQVIYLQKLLEASHRHHPGRLAGLLSQPVFAYANVPYRIKPYSDLLKNPYDTVVFDDGLEAEIEGRVKQNGADGKLVWGKTGEVYSVNLAEKLLVPVLAKFSNFIPGGGIWLNTQRPEWNDANNALVGNGVSMVTLYYMRRFQTFCRALFGQAKQEHFDFSEEVAAMLSSISKTLDEHLPLLKKTLTNQDRKTIVDGLGKIGSVYRTLIYNNGFSENKVSVSRIELLRFFEVTLQYIDHTIRANRRADGMYHAYNLMTIENEKELSVSHLYEMLEGQVAVLSAGLLSPEESLEVLAALRQSQMYRKDQHSYTLYPDRDLPRFLDKNNIPQKEAGQSELLAKLLAAGNHQLVNRDLNGVHHFNGSIRNANDVRRILRQLKTEGYAELVEKEETFILGVFEKMFDHKSFTGRSGTFFGYEGLGSIYWHMVSKLLLAAEEVYVWAKQSHADPDIVRQLGERYYDIRAGIGFNKTPSEYGAFPSDPYSHTPGNAGAQQPGMTGQVKEDILARNGELGIWVEEGKIIFRPWLLRKNEFVTASRTFHFFDLQGAPRQVDLEAGALAFTYCQTPIVFQLSQKKGIELTMKGGEKKAVEGLELNAEDSKKIFQRTGEVSQVTVRLMPEI